MKGDPHMLQFYTAAQFMVPYWWSSFENLKEKCFCTHCSLGNAESCCSNLQFKASCRAVSWAMKKTWSVCTICGFRGNSKILSTSHAAAEVAATEDHNQHKFMNFPCLSVKVITCHCLRGALKCAHLAVFNCHHSLPWFLLWSDLNLRNGAI